MNNPSVEPDLEQGRRFLKLLDPDADTHCFQTFDDFPLKRGSLARTLIGGNAKPLVDLQADGAGVFFAVNAIKGRRRLADKVTRVRAVFVDLDGAPLQPVLTCGLEPHAIVESSPGRYHAYWLVDDLPRDQFRSVQRAIAKRFGGDPSVIDLCRVMRLPGFYHLKGEPFQTRLHQVEQRLPYTAEQVLAEFPPQAETRKKPNGVHTETPFAAINGAALANLGAWIPELFPTARRSGKRWRVSSADLGQGYEEDLSITPDGAKHFGIHDMGDPREGKRTPLDLVMEYGGAPHVAAAGRWLAERLGIGFLEPSIEGKAIADRLLKNAQQPTPTRSDPAWPAPLDEAAFHGLAGGIVRAIEPHSEADPAALLLQFLAAFGNAAGRGHYIPIEGDRHPPQVWPVMIGETSKARKGTSWGRVQQLMGMASPVWAAERIVSGLSSGEGVIWQVRDPSGDDLVGVADKRLLVQEPEFASTLRHTERSGNTLSGTLRCFWDKGSVRALTKNSPVHTTNSMVTIVGHCTVEELRRYLTRTEMANGLANRFLFVCVRRSKKLPFGGGLVELDIFAEMVADQLIKINARGEKKVMWTDQARALWTDIYDELSEGRPGMLGAVTSRAEAQTLRLALTYALLDGSVYIEADHLRAAIAVWKYCDASAAYLFGEATGDPLADEIRRALDVAPTGLSRKDISSLFSRHQNANAIGAALDALEARGLARKQTRPTAGRSEERWFAQ